MRFLRFISNNVATAYIVPKSLKVLFINENSFRGFFFSTKKVESLTRREKHHVADSVTHNTPPIVNDID